jgi:hypothetical protein
MAIRRRTPRADSGANQKDGHQTQEEEHRVVRRIIMVVNVL